MPRCGREFCLMSFVFPQTCLSWLTEDRMQPMFPMKSFLTILWLRWFQYLLLVGALISMQCPVALTIAQWGRTQRISLAHHHRLQLVDLGLHLGSLTAGQNTWTPMALSTHLKIFLIQDDWMISHCVCTIQRFLVHSQNCATTPIIHFRIFSPKRNPVYVSTYPPLYPLSTFNFSSRSNQSLTFFPCP